MKLPIVDNPFYKPTKKQLKNVQKWVDSTLAKRKFESKNPIIIIKTKINMIAIHKKTGMRYIILEREVINKTNEQNGQRMVMYCPEGCEEPTIFVREEKEFLEKFDELKPYPIIPNT
jgi:hypothetical protein